MENYRSVIRHKLSIVNKKYVVLRYLFGIKDQTRLPSIETENKVKDKNDRLSEQFQNTIDKSSIEAKIDTLNIHVYICNRSPSRLGRGTSIHFIKRL